MFLYEPPLPKPKLMHLVRELGFHQDPLLRLFGIGDLHRFLTRYRDQQGPEMSDPTGYGLRGLRVGLSGAVPEQSEWGARALDWEILSAVSTLADAVFSDGVRLVHGSHPSFTPSILAQAEAYAHECGEAVVSFVLSALWADRHLARQLRQERYSGVLELIVVDAIVPPGLDGQGADDPRVRNPSLTAMRWRLVEEMDALVVIGGKHWRGSDNEPGTLQELDLAIERWIPCFLLGGFKGMAAELAARPDYRGNLGNDLSEADNAYLLTTDNAGRAVAMITESLACWARDRVKRR
jgi:hypothetical protein